MLEQYLKTIAQECDFSYDHLNKILTVNLEHPFSMQYKNGRLKSVGFLPMIDPATRSDLLVKLMQLNLALETTQNLSLGMTADDKLTLSSDLNFNLNYKQLKNHIESFANHLDKISSMIQDLNKKS